MNCSDKWSEVGVILYQFWALSSLLYVLFLSQNLLPLFEEAQASLLGDETRMAQLLHQPQVTASQLPNR